MSSTSASDCAVFNRVELQRRIDDLKKSLIISEKENDWIRAGLETYEIKQLEWVMNNSLSLIEVLKNAIDFGQDIRLSSTYINDDITGNQFIDYTDTGNDIDNYIKELKINI